MLRICRLGDLGSVGLVGMLGGTALSVYGSAFLDCVSSLLDGA